MARKRTHINVGLALIWAFGLAVGCGDDEDARTPNTAGKAGSGGVSGTGVDAGSSNGGSDIAGGNGVGGGAGNGGDPLDGGTGGTVGGGGTTTGSAGDGGGESLCGNGNQEPGEECDDNNTRNGDGCSHDCKAKCEQCSLGSEDPFIVDLSDLCFNDPEVALGGPRAGVALGELCADLVRCGRENKCGQSSPVSDECYCGSSAGTGTCNLDNQAAAGPCVAEYRAAAETGEATEIENRALNTDYAIGRAILILEYEQAFCFGECYLDRAKDACELCAVGSAPATSGPICSLPCGLTDTATDTACRAFADCTRQTGCAANATTALEVGAACYAAGTPCVATAEAFAGSNDPIVLNSKTDAARQSLACLASSCQTECFGAAQ